MKSTLGTLGISLLLVSNFYTTPTHAFFWDDSEKEKKSEEKTEREEREDTTEAAGRIAPHGASAASRRERLNTRANPSQPQKRGSGTSPSAGSSLEPMEGDSFQSLYPTTWDRFTLTFESYFYGPSVSNISPYQPMANGQENIYAPVNLQNYLSLGYVLSQYVAISGSLNWNWIPVLGQRVEMRDPFLRLSHDQIFAAGPFSLAGDIRVHFPTSTFSQESGLLTGLQSFQSLTYSPADSRFTLGTLSSVRYNWFETNGFGHDWELYLAPYVSYQLSQNLAFTLLYEMGTNHLFRDDPFEFNHAEADLEPGLSWNVTPQINLNPYLNIYTGEKLSWNSTSFGMTATWFIH